MEILSSGREHYRIFILLSIVANGTKLPPFIIIKGENGKSIEKELRILPYMRNGNVYIYCQPQGWCTSSLFQEWIKLVFLPYEKEYGEKCLLIIDKALGHISKDSLSFFDGNKINYVLIPGGITCECQPLDEAVNKVFKDQVKLLLEKDRLFYDNRLNKNKLKFLRINLLDYIYKVWYNDTIITTKIIKNGFQKAGKSNNFYLTNDEEKVKESYKFDVLNGMFEIEDDLGKELNANHDDENELDDIIEDNMNDDINSDMESEKNFIEEDTIQKGEYLVKEQTIKNDIEEFERKFSAYNEDKMDLD